MATTVTFQFWSSDNNVDFAGPYDDITEVADSRYIKVRATLTRDSLKMPVLEDMTVGYFKKSNILANWIFFSESARDIDSFHDSKVWTSKADWDAGTLSNTYCPIGLGQLELPYNELSGSGEFTLDVGSGNTADWLSFSHTKENAKTIWRDDFRTNSISKYTWYNLPGWNDGAAIMPTYDSTNKRLVINTGDNDGTTLEIPGVSLQNAIASIDVYITGQYPTNSATLQYLRYADSDNSYVMLHQAVGASVESGIDKWLAGENTGLTEDSGRFPKDTRRWLIFEINGNALKGHTDEYEHNDTDESFSSANKILMGCYQTIGYIYHVLVEHYTLPSPINNTLSFEFYKSSDGTNWAGPYSSISEVPDSRYLKVRVTMSRVSFLGSAMPVLKDMTVGYFVKGT